MHLSSYKCLTDAVVWTCKGVLMNHLISTYMNVLLSDEEEWTEVTSLSKSKPCRRYGHSAVVADNSMWVFGGLSGLSPCADLWRYSFCEFAVFI